MSAGTRIEWTDATWNPVTGCDKVGPGCDNCYAERIAERFRGTPGHPFESGFDLTLRPERLEQPRRWRNPRRVFVNSMSDLFHKDIPAPFVDSVFDVMEDVGRHVFQVLTKRSSLMRDYALSRYASRSPPDNVWMGVSVENKRYASRIAHLRQTPAAVRFVSFEPLIGPVEGVDLAGVHWVIAGGESGPRARPADERWFADLRDACLRQNVAFFFKQWGGIRPRSGGKTLQGREWREFPVAAGG